MEDYVTTGQISELHGADRDQVCYAIRKLRIKAAATAANVRLFDQESVKRIKEYLDKIRAQK